MAQPAYAQPAYAENANLNQNFDQGYAHREGMAGSGPAGSTYHDSMGFIKSKWPACFMAVTGFQALLCLAFEA